MACNLKLKQFALVYFAHKGTYRVSVRDPEEKRGYHFGDIEVDERIILGTEI
jgi:hypothetical protein